MGSRAGGIGISARQSLTRAREVQAIKAAVAVEDPFVYFAVCCCAGVRGGQSVRRSCPGSGDPAGFYFFMTAKGWMSRELMEYLESGERFRRGPRLIPAKRIGVSWRIRVVYKGRHLRGADGNVGPVESPVGEMASSQRSQSCMPWPDGSERFAGSGLDRDPASGSDGCRRLFRVTAPGGWFSRCR